MILRIRWDLAKKDSGVYNLYEKITLKDHRGLYFKVMLSAFIKP